MAFETEEGNIRHQRNGLFGAETRRSDLADTCDVVDAGEARLVQGVAMQRRQGSLAPLYKSGAIGFADNGSVAVRDMNAVPLPQRNQVKKLVADENADRTKLYREIAKENGHPEWEGKVRGTFAKVWVQEAPGGYFYQQGGGWKQK